MPPISLPPLGATTAPVPVQKVPEALEEWRAGATLRNVEMVDALQQSAVQDDAVELVASLESGSDVRQIRVFLVRGMLVHALERNRTPMEALVRCLFWPSSKTSVTWRQGLSKAGELYMAAQTVYQLKNYLAAKAKNENEAWALFAQERSKRTEEMRERAGDAYLQAINTMLEGQVIDISAVFAGENESIRLGRSPDCEVQLEMLSISSEHCILSGEVTGSGQRLLRVSDLRSTNGTLINGEFLLRNGRAKDLDIIQLGPLRFQLHLEKSASGATGPDQPDKLNLQSPSGAARDTLHLQVFPGKITLPESEDANSSFHPRPGGRFVSQGTREELPKLADLDLFYSDDSGTIRSVFGISEIVEIAPQKGKEEYCFEIRAHGSTGFKHTVTAEKYDALSAKLARLQAAIRRLTH